MELATLVEIFEWHMEQFSFYFKQGIQHITDMNGLDHMIFIITLCAVFTIKEWKHLLVLITAFTIGHTVTLALSSLQIIAINQDLVETLIPITILLTSIYNVTKKHSSHKAIQFNYFLALGFGLIHGMGFSNFFRAMMMGITDASIAFPLFAFNVGIEVGQLFIVAIFMCVLYVFMRLFSMSHRSWNLYISGAGGGVALTMIIQNLM